jgi:hypothetical protein
MVSVQPSDFVAFTFGFSCYSPSPQNPFASSNPAIVAAHDTIDFLHGSLRPEFTCTSGIQDRYVYYKLYDVSNTSDTTSVMMHYIYSGLGVEEAAKSNGTISNAFPNPTNSVVSFKYEISEYSSKGQIVIFDMLGKAIKTVPLTDKRGTAKIQVNDLNSGIYFYSIIVDGKAFSTKKFVIQEGD